MNLEHYGHVIVHITARKSINASAGDEICNVLSCLALKAMLCEPTALSPTRCFHGVECMRSQEDTLIMLSAAQDVTT